jgi:ribonuclease Z
MIEVILLGAGSPIADAARAGPSTLVRAGGQTFLADCGRGVLQRATAVGVGANSLTALLLTHLHSDHIADLGDLLITRWVTTFTPGRVRARHRLPDRPSCRPHRAAGGRRPRAHRRRGLGSDGVQIRAAPTDHRPVAPTVGFRIEYEGASLVLAGDTVPCESLDRLAARAGALVHTVIRKDLVQPLPQQRIRDICDYHSSVEEAAATAARAGVGMFVLTHCVPAVAPGQEDEWRAKAASAFDGRIEIGPDLHRIEVHAPA